MAFVCFEHTYFGYSYNIIPFQSPFHFFLAPKSYLLNQKVVRSPATASPLLAVSPPVDPSLTQQPLSRGPGVNSKESEATAVAFMVVNPRGCLWWWWWLWCVVLKENDGYKGRVD